jgi:two-component system NarL family sensor kinase
VDHDGVVRRQPAGDSAGRWTVAVPVTQFAVAGLLAVVVVGIATSAASRRVGQREAIVDARTTTLVKAQNIVEPVVTNGLVTEAPAAVAAVDRVVRQAVLDKSLVRVKIWSRDGKILYSDEPRLRGATYKLGTDEIRALDDGVIEADVSDLSQPENRFERGHGKLLEVYLPIRTPTGQRLLFEAYYRYDAVSASGRRIWRSFAPVAIGALIALELVQIPLAWSLARRLRQRQREREALLQQAVDASESERRRIASDLHDGVVQDLAGVAYGLAGSARKQSSPEAGQLLDDAAVQVRDSIKSLRTLLVEIYPPRLAEAGLPAALTDLVALASNRGLAASLDVDGLTTTPPEPVAALGYRAAREGIRNALTHAHATNLAVTAATTERALVIDVADDGVGFSPAEVADKAGQGHLGLRGLEDLLAAVGGRLEITGTSGEGTHMHVEVPLR